MYTFCSVHSQFLGLILPYALWMLGGGAMLITLRTTMLTLAPGGKDSSRVGAGEAEGASAGIQAGLGRSRSHWPQSGPMSSSRASQDTCPPPTPHS